MDVISNKGRTAVIYRFKEGLVCKIPWDPGHKHLAAEFEKAIAVEKQLLERLGTHTGIIRYHGPCNIKGMKNGLVLSEANCGDLQSYIDRKDTEIDEALRKKWCLQLANSVTYIHENDIIHMNLSTTNVLLHRTGQTTDAILADFGGSRCLKLDLHGGLIPDDPYRDPQLTEFSSPKVDLFSLGIIIYIIMTGHYPFYKRPAPEGDEMYAYGDQVQKLYREGEFPDLSGVPFGDVIAGCCCERRFETAKEVFVALEAADSLSMILS